MFNFAIFNNFFVFFLIFIIIFFIIFIHELAHYLTARWLKIPVKSFVIGIGPLLYSYRSRSGVVWSIRLFPILGYVQFFDHHDTDRDFNNHAPWKRVLVVLAGPGANFALAFVLFIIYNTHFTYSAPMSRIMDHELFNTDFTPHAVENYTKYKSFYLPISDFVEINNQRIDALLPGDHILNFYNVLPQLFFIFRNNIDSDYERFITEDSEQEDYESYYLCAFLSSMPLETRVMHKPFVGYLRLNNAHRISDVSDQMILNQQHVPMTDDYFLKQKQIITDRLTNIFNDGPEQYEFFPYIDFDAGKEYWWNRTALMQRIMAINPQLMISDAASLAREHYHLFINDSCHKDGFATIYSQETINNIKNGLKEIFAHPQDRHRAFNQDTMNPQPNIKQIVYNYLMVPIYFDLLIERPSQNTDQFSTTLSSIIKNNKEKMHDSSDLVRVRLEGTRLDIATFLQSLANNIDYIPWHKQTWRNIKTIVVNSSIYFVLVIDNVFRNLADLFSGETQVNQNLRGIIGISNTMYDIFTQDTQISMLLIIAMISIGIAVINLLPIPIADGGKLIFLLLESFVSVKIIRKIELYLSIISAVFLFILFIYISYYDILRIMN